MASPFEYRELMKAQFQFNETRSVDQVLAEHSAKHDQDTKSSKNRKKYIGTNNPPPLGTVQQGELDKVKALLGHSG